MYITPEMFLYRVGRLPTQLELALVNNQTHHCIDPMFCGWNREDHLPNLIHNSQPAPDGWSAANTPMTVRFNTPHGAKEYLIGTFKAPVPRHSVKATLLELCKSFQGTDTDLAKCQYLRNAYITLGWIYAPSDRDLDLVDPRPALREHMMENGISVRELAQRCGTTNKDIKKVFRLPIDRLWLSSLVRLSNALGLRPTVMFENLDR